jgi:ankyrin repeat protein
MTASVRHAAGVDSLRDRVRAYVLRAHAASAQVAHDQWRRQQPEWERRWEAPGPAWIRDGIFAILDRHGVLDPAAPGRFADIGAREPLQDWGGEVLAGAVAAGRGTQAVIGSGGDQAQPRDGADFVRLVIPFAEVTGGDWQPAGLRASQVTAPGGAGSRVLVDFVHAGQPHRWELRQAPEDGLTQAYLDCVAAFARDYLPGEFVIREPGSGETFVTYVPGPPAAEVRALLRRWPTAAQLVAMVRHDAAGTWGERGGNRIFIAGRRLGLGAPDYDAPAPDGARPLHEAARLGQAPAVRYMLRGGADPRLRDGAGRQAIDLAAEPALRDFIASWTERMPGPAS